ncbi:hypothetical protein TNCV_4604171 [Trichonephila clavipes]|nr:hypothetical protein TNCV_4604171 [Trichonephila clavipes]
MPSYLESDALTIWLYHNSLRSGRFSGIPRILPVATDVRAIGRVMWNTLVQVITVEWRARYNPHSICISNRMNTSSSNYLGKRVANDDFQLEWC